MLGKMKASAASLKDKAGDLKDKAGDLQNAGIDKIKDFMNDLNDMIPVLQEIGFRMNEVEVELGLPPKVVPHFEQTEVIEQEKIDEVLAKYKDQKITSLILSSLLKAATLKESVKIGDLKFSEVEIELGAIPSVNVKFA